MDDEIDTVEAGPLRERELARRGDVRADSLVAQHAQERDVRQRLRPEEHASVADCAANRARGRDAAPDQHGAQGRAELVGEGRRLDPTERQSRAVQRSRVGEQRQHGRIVPVSIGHVEQLLT